MGVCMWMSIGYMGVYLDVCWMYDGYMGVLMDV